MYSGKQYIHIKITLWKITINNFDFSKIYNLEKVKDLTTKLAFKMLQIKNSISSVRMGKL